MTTDNKPPMINFQQFGIGFSIALILISAIALIYLSLWGNNEDNSNAINVVIIFGFMLLVSTSTIIAVLVLQWKNQSMDELWGDWSFDIPALGFLIGFWIQSMVVLISNGIDSFSLLSIKENSLLSSFSGELPIFGQFFTNSIMVPIIEELVWLIFIPQLVFVFLWSFGWKLDFVRNVWFKVAITVGVIIASAYTFAKFHVGNINVEFFIAAMIFRTILIVLFWGDKLFDLLPKAVVGFSAMVGFHIGNNWMTYGFWEGTAILFSNPLGIMLWIFFIPVMIWRAYDFVAEKIDGENSLFPYKTLGITVLALIIPVIVGLIF